MVDLKNRTDFTIVIGVKEETLAQPVVKSLHPLQTHILIGKDYPSFSKLVNDCITLSPTEIVIFCSHRVRPTPKDIERLLQRIDDGYGLATLYRLGCFGLRKELVRRMGFFDERFLIGGWEDNDFFLRLQEADIAYFEDESIPYIGGESLWKHPEDKPLKSKQHYNAKWDRNETFMTMSRLLPEITHYDIGESDKSVVFKKWSESHLLRFSMWQNMFTLVSKEQLLTDKHILVFGGTGSLGHKIVEMYGAKNKITVYSRDENKHWQMSLKHKQINFIMGDIRDPQRVSNAIMRTRPDIIIIASAVKHVDRCEYEVSETLQINSIGAMNVSDCVSSNYCELSNLSHVVYVSTDKACSPINTYGLSKALAEKVMIEAAYKMKDVCSTKFLNIRYGNVLNSRGSIIEVLNNIGNSIAPYYKLTHPDMTRFIMTQEESVQLINYAILKAQSGDTVIPKLASMLIKDLVEIFARKFSKQIEVTGIRPGEKMHEALLNETEVTRLVEHSNYFIVEPPYRATYTERTLKYDSSIPIVTRESLASYLEKRGFLK
ncbi:MAG: NAD-dependent epimerase/dehydratase family protein [Proteobacteria bacterium]|nr:NAD-dependent epimerase/dehydratase family protein [Pseudomonadota bacterium]NBP15888.1 NAD-dependent epimerase/dehydratase family protein [bacterium]